MTTKITITNFDDLWDYNQPAATEGRFRAILPQFANDPAHEAEVLTQIARTQGLQRQFVEAHATLDRVQDLLAIASVRVQIRYLLERGRVFNSAGEVTKARPLFLEAWALAQKAGEDFHAIDAAHMLGIIEPPAEQQRWNRLALELTEQTPDPHAKEWLASLSNNIGWSYFDQGDYTAALAHFYTALHAREGQGATGAIRIARWCVAKTLRVLGRIEEALAIQQNLLHELQQVGEEDGYVYEELGECFLLQSQPEQAARFFATAYQILAQDPWLAANEGERLARLKMLGQEGE